MVALASCTTNYAVLLWQCNLALPQLLINCFRKRELFPVSFSAFTEFQLRELSPAQHWLGNNIIIMFVHLAKLCHSCKWISALSSAHKMRLETYCTPTLFSRVGCKTTCMSIWHTTVPCRRSTSVWRTWGLSQSRTTCSANANTLFLAL